MREPTYHGVANRPLTAAAPAPVVRLDDPARQHRPARLEQLTGHDQSKVARERRLRIGIFAAQYIFGVLIAAKLGDLWGTMAVCLVVGWTGTQALDWLAKRTGFGGDK